MAKVDLANLAPGATPLSRGNFLVRDTKHGPVAQAWPIGRGKPKTPYDFYKQAEFWYAAKMAANPYPLDLGTAIEMVKDTTLVPRDFLMMCAYGRAYVIENPDGTQWSNVRDMAPNPQYVLDLITTTAGTIIWRSQEGWIAEGPGNVSQVLTTTPNGVEWLDLPEPYAPPDIQALLDSITDVEGAILYRDATGWVALDPGDDNQVLTLDGGVPTWQDSQYVPPPTPPPPTGSKTAENQLVLNSGSPTWSGLALGPAAAGRIIIAAVTTSRSTAIGARSIASLAMNGTNMTPTQTELQFGSQVTMNIFALADASALSGTFVLTLSGANAAHAITVYSFTGLASASPDDTAQTSGSNPTSSIDNQANGVLVMAGAACAGTLGAITWTGASPDNDGSLSTTYRSSAASAASLAATTNRTIGVSSSATNEGLVAATFH